MVSIKGKRQYLTFKEAAEEFGVSVTCLRRATKDAVHPLPFVCPRGQTRGFKLYRPDLEKWLQECRVVAGATG